MNPLDKNQQTTFTEIHFLNINSDDNNNNNNPTNEKIKKTVAELDNDFETDYSLKLDNELKQLKITNATCDRIQKLVKEKNFSQAIEVSKGLIYNLITSDTWEMLYKETKNGSLHDFVQFTMNSPHGIVSQKDYSWAASELLNKGIDTALQFAISNPQSTIADLILTKICNELIKNKNYVKLFEITTAVTEKHFKDMYLNIMCKLLINEEQDYEFAFRVISAMSNKTSGDYYLEFIAYKLTYDNKYQQGKEFAQKISVEKEKTRVLKEIEKENAFFNVKKLI